MEKRFSVIIAALNEEATIGSVVRELRHELGQRMRECIVVNNGSTDATASIAASAGARVVNEPRRGYGRACARGVEQSDPRSETLVFLDGDGSDVPGEVPRLAEHVTGGHYDFAIGSRIRGRREQGSMFASQIFAGRLFGAVIRLRYGVQYTDMGPMRVISREALSRMQMTEMTYGWNLEMQIKAAAMKLRMVELPVAHRCRQGGESKVAGSLRGSVGAASRLIQVMFRMALLGHHSN